VAVRKANVVFLCGALLSFVCLGVALAAFFHLSIAPSVFAAADKSNVIVVMIDGLRWQEVFRGADPAIASNEKFMQSPWAPEVRSRFVEVPDRSMALMPFVNGEIASRGALIGNRDKGSCAEVANDYWISYPGYSEALTGVADPRIDSNDFGPNPNVTFLEWLNRRPGLSERVRAVGSWEAIAAIINVDRSHLPTNVAGMMSGRFTPAMALLNRVIQDTPIPWNKSARFDWFTHEIALETLRADNPRVLFIQYAQPDDFAHEGDYPQYLLSAHRVDQSLKELWSFIQTDPHYAVRTTLIVTVDHGRGGRADDSWRWHAGPAKMKTALGIVGSNEIWIGAIGPQVSSGTRIGEAARACARLSQIASTALTAIGEDWRQFNPHAAPPLDVFERTNQIEEKRRAR
jgi:Metalloenzyme superfamily